MIEIREVKGIKDLIRFIISEYRINRNTDNFVPPLFIQRLMALKSSAFKEHGKIKLFIACRGKEVLGRISAHVDFLHLKRWGDETGFFGFFETVDSEEVAHALFRSAEKFLREQGMKKIRGPFSFNINGEVGILVEGFESPPYVMMTHNPPYYAELVESYGFRKAKDLFAWHIDKEMADKKLSSFLKIFWKEAHGKIRVKEITRKSLKDDIKFAIDIFNDAWSENWGFVPVTEKEAREIADSLKLVLDEKMAFFAISEDGEPAGVCIGVPNINEVLIRTKGGLYPQDYVKIFLNLKKIKSIRLMLLGVKKKFREKYPYLPLFMVGEFAKRGRERGYERAELSWTLEDNERINKIIKIAGAEKYKTYRIYEKEIGEF